MRFNLSYHFFSQLVQIRITIYHLNSTQLNGLRMISILTNGFGKVWKQPELIEDVLDFICSKAKGHKIRFLWCPMLHGPNDEFILELAITAHVDFIVTHNIRDFVGTNKFGI